MPLDGLRLWEENSSYNLHSDGEEGDASVPSIDELISLREESNDDWPFFYFYRDTLIYPDFESQSVAS